MSTTESILQAAKHCLSPARMTTYENATGSSGDSDTRALALYAWNAQVSAALLAPLHICEVVVRNAISEALQAVYGDRWPWQSTFVLSLPDPKSFYNPRRDLKGAAATHPSTGKVIPELKFMFWQEMLTYRHDRRLWDGHLKSVFPAHDPMESVVTLRKRIFADLEAVRKLRNRIAHHEPIFARNMREDLEHIIRLVELRSPLVASWMVANQDAATLIAKPPAFKGGSLWTPTEEEIARIQLSND